VRTASSTLWESSWFAKGVSAVASIADRGTDGYVVIDAVQWLRGERE
jgi:hypothetical protein